MNIKDSVIDELTRLDLMGGRVPYTHHHDYVRSNAARANFMSRADVAKLDANEDELYACAFLQALEGMTTRQKVCSGIHIGLYTWCSLIAEEHLADLDKILGEDNASA